MTYKPQSSAKPESAMKQQKFEELMQRYHGQMDGALYAMEQFCPCPDALKKKHFSVPFPELSCTLQDVPYECPMRDYNALCRIPKMRHMLGDHVQQHDIEIPEDDTQAQRKRAR